MPATAKQTTQNGTEAWESFLAGRFAWGSDPKNPFPAKTAEWFKWREEYLAAMGNWFAQ